MSRGKRYSRILESAKYYSAIDNYIRYITDATRRGTKVGQGRARPRSQRLFVVPFGVALKTGQKAKSSGAQTAWTAHSAKFAGRTDATVPTDESNIVKLDDFSPARVIIVTGRSSRGTVKTSDVTRLKYLSYGGTSTSLPFGKKDATDTMTGAFTEIKNSIVTGAATPPAVSLRPEKVT